MDLFKESGTFRPLTLASNVKQPQPMKQVESLIEIKRGASLRSQKADLRLPIEPPTVPSPRRKQQRRKSSSRRLTEATEPRYERDEEVAVAELGDIHVMSDAPSIAELDRATSLRTEKSFNNLGSSVQSDSVNALASPTPDIVVLGSSAR